MNCENQSARAVDLGTTLRVAPRVHSPSSNNRPERNENCVTHVVGLKCYLCRRLLTGACHEFAWVRGWPCKHAARTHTPAASGYHLLLHYSITWSARSRKASE